MNLTKTLVACLLLALAACSSTGGEEIADEHKTAYAAPDCSCGTEDGILLGCEFDACVSGAGNSANPECFCYSPLSAGGFRGGEFAGSGGAGGHEAGASGAQRERYIYLRSGKQYKGTVQSDDQETLVLLTIGGNEKAIPYSELAPRTVYALNQSKVAESDFDGQIKVANYARDNELFGYAKRHYQRALKADESRLEEVQAEVAILRQYASEAELDKARVALDEDDTRKARKHLTNVVEEFPGEPAAEVATALFDGIFERERQQEVVASAERSEDAQRKLEPAQKHLARARDHERKGLKYTNSQTQAIRSFNDSVASAKRAYGLLDKLDKRKSSSPELLSAVAVMKEEVKTVGVDSYVHAANGYLNRGSYNNAVKSANAALKIDPDNDGARSVRRRAEDAVNDRGFGWGWYPGGRPGWGWGGGGRVGGVRMRMR